ncbi:MAG: hypothetical protein ACXWL2_02395 [Candidatus Chromulinivorax sp.]
MQQRLIQLKSYILTYLELQLLIFIVILPILIAWGLPISVMSIVGNLLFTQFLTAFIFLSAILFCINLFGMSNSYIIIALEWLSRSWYYLLSFGKPSWLIGFPTSIFPISCLLVILALLMYRQKIVSQKVRVLLLACNLASLLMIDYLYKPQLTQITILQGLQKMHIIKCHNKIYAFDCGALGARLCSQSWIEFTLTPALIKNFGCIRLDQLILCKCNSRTPDAIQALQQQIFTNKITCIQRKNCKTIDLNSSFLLL